MRRVAKAVEGEGHRADGVFEGGGVKGIAFAGAIAAAEERAGVQEWVNVAGTSAGSIVAALLAVGYRAADMKRILREAKYRKFADYGFGGMFIGGVRNALRLRGLAPGDYFAKWMSDQLAASPLGKKLGRELTFADLKRTDLPPKPPEMDDAEYERAKYRLHVIASDVTAGRMVVLPGAISGYTTEDGTPLQPDELKVVDAVRMSMSYPFLFNPVSLHQAEKPHYLIDGGLLSNFPIWLFDSPNPKRPTWGFRLHPGVTADEQPSYRRLRRPLWEPGLVMNMFSAAMEAWDHEQMSRVTKARTMSIPTHGIKTTDFKLSDKQATDLYDWGFEAGENFFMQPETLEYRNSFGLVAVS
jgi:NTE family protein